MTAAIPIAEDHSPSVENMRSRDGVSPGQETGSDYRISLDRLIKTSTTPRSQFAEGNAPSNDSELGCDEVSLGLCSTRSVITAALGHLSPRSVISVPLGFDKKFISDDYDSELEVSETQFDESEAGEMSSRDEFGEVLEFGPCRSVAPQTQGCNTDHENDGEMRRVRVRALPFRRVGFLPPSMNFEEHMINNCRQRNRKKRKGKAFSKIIFDQNKQCRCTGEDNVDDDPDGPPDLDWTPPNSDNDDDCLLYTSDAADE